MNVILPFSLYSSNLYREISYLFHGICDLSDGTPSPRGINGQLEQVTLVTGTSLSDGFQCLLCLWKKKQDPFDVKMISFVNYLTINNSI